MPETSPILTRQALNRATLARQHLLERSSVSALDLVEHLVGMQAQVPTDPYVGAWSRLRAFAPDELSTAVATGAAVRLGVMRGTLHLLTSADARAIWPLMRSVLRRTWSSSTFRRDLAGLDTDEVVERGIGLLEEGPLTAAVLGARLADAFPGRPPGSLAATIRYLAPVVQVPPRGTWGARHAATWTTLAAWTRLPPVEASAESALEALVMRYLGAFGPASVMDVQAWCWLTKLGAVVDRLRPRLMTFRDERGRELFDLPEAPRPDEHVPAPVRFLPEYDNLLLSHDDRTRVIDDETRAWMRTATGLTWGTVLVDGMVRARWRLERPRAGGSRAERARAERARAERARLVVQARSVLSPEVQRAVEAEGHALLSLLEPGRPADVALVAT